MGEKVSIITISYNSEKTIEKTMLSVLEQSYRPLEYVLVDGGSTDGTVQLIESYIPKFQELGIEINFKSEADKGISDAFNKGIERSTGDIIGITNTDDTILPGTLQYVSDNFPKDVDVFYGNILWEDKEKSISYIRKSSADLSDLKIRLKILHPAAYIRSSSYSKYGKYDINYKFCMDKQLFARMQRLGAKFLYVDKTLVSVSAGGVSDNNLAGVVREGKKIAIENGVKPIVSSLIFTKNYIIVKAKTLLKNNRLVLKAVERKKKL